MIRLVELRLNPAVISGGILGTGKAKDTIKLATKITVLFISSRYNYFITQAVYLLLQGVRNFIHVSWKWDKLVIPKKTGTTSTDVWRPYAQRLCPCSRWLSLLVREEFLN